MNNMRKLMEAVKLNEESVEYRDPDGDFMVIYSFPRGYIAKGRNDCGQDISGESFDNLDDAIEHAEICLSIADDSEHDGQPSDYEEMQDYMGGDDWDHGQYDESVEQVNEDPANNMLAYIENEINDLVICTSELELLAREASAAGDANRSDYIKNAERLIKRAVENLEYAKTDK